MTGPDLTRFIRVADRSAASPVIVHVPHAGRAVPGHLRSSFLLPDAGLEDELTAMTDASTDRIADAVPGASRVEHGLSRLVVDVERFVGDDEEMNRVGMGVLYTHGSRRQEIRRPSPREREALLDYMHAYSAAFTELVRRTLERHGRAVILDLHSYPRDPLPYELHADERRPELCLGTDPLHTPDALIRAAHDAFTGFDIVENEPFHGTYVPLPYYGRDARVQSVMLEIRRDRYLDDGGRVDESRLAVVARGLVTLAEASRPVGPTPYRSKWRVGDDG